jgi:hypothetical protein
MNSSHAGAKFGFHTPKRRQQIERRQPHQICMVAAAG